MSKVNFVNFMPSSHTKCVKLMLLNGLGLTEGGVETLILRFGEEGAFFSVDYNKN